MRLAQADVAGLMGGSGAQKLPETEEPPKPPPQLEPEPETKDQPEPEEREPRSK